MLPPPSCWRSTTRHPCAALPSPQSTAQAAKMTRQMVWRAQALLTQLAGFFVTGSHCIAEHAITVRTTGAPCTISTPAKCPPCQAM